MPNVILSARLQNVISIGRQIPCVRPHIGIDRVGITLTDIQLHVVDPRSGIARHAADDVSGAARIALQDRSIDGRGEARLRIICIDQHFGRVAEHHGRGGDHGTGRAADRCGDCRIGPSGNGGRKPLADLQGICAAEIPGQARAACAGSRLSRWKLIASQRTDLHVSQERRHTFLQGRGDGQ